MIDVNYNEWIGKRVRKVTGKPFKSTFKINTVIGVCVHDHRPGLAFRFKEDASHVACETCVLVPEDFIPITQPNVESDRLADKILGRYE